MAIKASIQSLDFPCGRLAVNDVFYSCWGYEQTNINFYQVVGIRGKQTVLLREIRADIVSRDQHMGGEKKPRLNDFLNEIELTRRVISKYGEIEVKIEDFERATLTTPDKSHSFTSYA